jgi:hypothetical protein
MCRRDRPVDAFELAHRCCRDCERTRAAGAKRCALCKEVKPSADFYERALTVDGLESKCKACISEKDRNRNVTPAARQRNRELKYRRKYGITIADYEAMLISQGNSCAICRRAPEGTERLQVDHDHTTGHVRALLCLQCNALLGQAHDDTAVLMAAVRYLERHRHESTLGS